MSVDEKRWTLLKEIARQLSVLNSIVDDEHCSDLTISEVLSKLFKDASELQKTIPTTSVPLRDWAKLPDKPFVKLASEFCISRHESLLDFVWFHLDATSREKQRFNPGRPVAWPKPSQNELVSMRLIVSYWTKCHEVSIDLIDWLRTEEDMSRMETTLAIQNPTSPDSVVQLWAEEINKNKRLKAEGKSTVHPDRLNLHARVKQRERDNSPKSAEAALLAEQLAKKQLSK